MPWPAIHWMYRRSSGSSICASAVRGRTVAGVMPLRAKPVADWTSSMGRASVGGELAVDAPVRLLDVLEDDLHLVGGGLADLHHGLGDGGGDLALLLVGASREPLHCDVWHRRLIYHQHACGMLTVGQAGRGYRRGVVAVLMAMRGRVPRGVAVASIPRGRESGQRERLRLTARGRLP